MDKNKTTSIKEIFSAMDMLSKRPYEYFAAGIGFILVVVGLFGQPWKTLTQEELWAISAFGGVGLISGLIVAIKKADYTMRTNLEKINYKKFVAAEKTKRIELAHGDSSEANLPDLESF